jgi:hypothetical protein
MIKAERLAAVRKWVSAAGARTAGALFVVYVTGAMVFDSGSVALRVSGAAFVAALALASAAFSYSRTAHRTDMGGEVTFAGERLLQASSMFLLASLFKYGSDSVPRHMVNLLRLLAQPATDRVYTFDLFIRVLFNSFAFVLFFVGVTEFQSGFLRLIAIANHTSRRFGHPDYVSAEVYERTLDRMSAQDVGASIANGPKPAKT